MPARIESCSPASLPTTRISTPIWAPSGNSGSSRRLDEAQLRRVVAIEAEVVHRIAVHRLELDLLAVQEGREGLDRPGRHHVAVRQDDARAPRRRRNRWPATTCSTRCRMRAPCRSGSRPRRSRCARACASSARIPRARAAAAAASPGSAAARSAVRSRAVAACPALSARAASDPAQAGAAAAVAAAAGAAAAGAEPAAAPARARASSKKRGRRLRSRAA